MAKKSTRPKARPTAKPTTKSEIVEREEVKAEPAPSTAVRAPKVPKASRSQVAAERLEDEYSYITGDLRRVFILAGAMFALLIALNLILSLMGA
jgi:hypothetical protein